ncbi:TetR/AcrR family transcriptional regulator C-terminal domain-containing protein [Streptosporangium roseum]|uniref:TetR/AcrR family transcriptional regulator C-terminal domain-containing protein n=1 Tax=Streptosporangium roseum TaxID=2001 RepID=UPI001FE1F7CC|nr:TetR/AcrR family transcriptional regulator C-terminal domain-containing protein [Streptosporangium roseum]
MADRLQGEIDVTGMPSGDWRADLTRYADGLRAMWLRHPWIITVHRALRPQPAAADRTSDGPPGRPHLHRREPPPHGAMPNSYVEGTVREEIGSAEEVRRGGLSESEWMAWSYPRIQQLVNSGSTRSSPRS